MLTDKECDLLGALGRLGMDFAADPPLTPNEVGLFLWHIQHLQNIILARGTLRDLNDQIYIQSVGNSGLRPNPTPPVQAE